MSKIGNQNYQHKSFPKMVFKGKDELIVNDEDELAVAVEDGYEDRTARRNKANPKAKEAAPKPKPEAKPKVTPKPPAEAKGPITL